MMDVHSMYVVDTASLCKDISTLASLNTRQELMSGTWYLYKCQPLAICAFYLQLAPQCVPRRLAM